MELSEYVSAERGRAASLARGLGVKPVVVSRWANGKKPVPVERCPSIERLTGGVVLCEQLRPDVEWGYLRNSSKPQQEAHFSPEQGNAA